MTEKLHRYPGAKPFETSQQNIFFGREKDVEVLCRKLRQEPLTVLYSKSGMGKSSLLNAGVVPAMEAAGEYRCLRIRFSAFNREAPADGQLMPILRCRETVRGGQQSASTFLDKLIPDEPSLWHDLKEQQLLATFAAAQTPGLPTRLLLLFDQFEELFTYPPEAVLDFRKQLAEALYTPLPSRYWDVLDLYGKDNPLLDEAELQLLQEPLGLRVIMAIRQDRMHLLGQLSDYLPSVSKTWYELRPLDQAQARAAILQPAALKGNFRSAPFGYEPEALEAVISFLTDKRTEPVESTQLQIICDSLERRMAGSSADVLRLADVGDLESVIENYYLEKIATVGSVSEQMAARRLVEEGLVYEEEERRLSLYEGIILKNYGVSAATLRNLVDCHLLRAEPSLQGGYTYELSHDTLVAPVLKAKARRKEAEGEAAAREAARQREVELAELRKKAEEERQQAAQERALRAQAEVAKKEAERLQLEAEQQRLLAQEALTGLEKAVAEIRIKNQSAFESFAGLGTRLIYSLDHAEALEKMRVAVDIEVEAALKQAQLTDPVCELLYFFAEGGRRPELAREAAGMLLQLKPEAEFAPVLQRCIQESWRTRGEFAPLLTQFPAFSKYQKRYYPETISIPLGADGIFQMGSDASDWGHQSDELLHRVKISPYRMSVAPTTFYQYALYSEASGRDLASRTPYWGRCGDHPLVNVNWYDAVKYANWLNVQQGLSPVCEMWEEVNSDADNVVRTDFLKWKVEWKPEAKGYRLPTEAEWELAARAGCGAPKNLFAGSDTLDEVGWYWENSGNEPLSGNWDLNRIYDNKGRTHPVMSKKDNGIGIFDMSGNVYEWCWDWYAGDYYEDCHKAGIATNPLGPKSSSDGRVIRGGGWFNDPVRCRVAYRNGGTPDDRDIGVGVRLVLVP